jgi:SAM-dependent methyltransferase
MQAGITKIVKLLRRYSLSKWVVVPADTNGPYVPTENKVVEGMLKLAGVKSTDVVYDLGCGDGRIVIMAAENFGAHGVGVDINPVRIQEAARMPSRTTLKTSSALKRATYSMPIYTMPQS